MPDPQSRRHTGPSVPASTRPPAQTWGLAWAHCVAHVPRVCAGVKGGPRTILLVTRNCLARMKCPLPLSARAEQGLFNGHTRPCSLRAGAPTPESSAHVPRIPPSVKGGPRTRRLVASNCLARTGCRKRRPTWGRGGLDPLPLSARACVCSEQGLYSGHTHTPTPDTDTDTDTDTDKGRGDCVHVAYLFSQLLCFVGHPGHLQERNTSCKHPRILDVYAEPI